VPGRREDPLPRPVTRGLRVLGKESSRKLHVAGGESGDGTARILAAAPLAG
jgi:hypothetical protein